MFRDPQGTGLTTGTIHTIGHSTRSLDELVALLRSNGVDCLVDVRAFPGSRRHPQFNKENLESALPAAGIAYAHLRGLGGRRKASEAVEPSPNTAWRNESFRRYADYALGEEFETALKTLEELASEKSCALMCSEAVWWRCHRRIISDWLLARGWKVLHIMSEGRTEAASMTPEARIVEEHKVVYGAAPQGRLF